MGTRCESGTEVIELNKWINGPDISQMRVLHNYTQGRLFDKQSVHVF